MGGPLPEPSQKDAHMTLEFLNHIRRSGSMFSVHPSIDFSIVQAHHDAIHKQQGGRQSQDE